MEATGIRTTLKSTKPRLVAYFVAGDARAYPENSRTDWIRGRRLNCIGTAFARSRFERYAELAAKAGVDISTPMKEFLKRALPDEVITTRIDVSAYADLKLDALNCHASQMDPNSFWTKIPPSIRKDGLKFETLIRAESRVAPFQGIEDDLFVGIE